MNKGSPLKHFFPSFFWKVERFIDNAELYQAAYFLHAHLGMLLSYPLLSVIFISFPSFQDPYRSGTDCQDK